VHLRSEKGVLSVSRRDSRILPMIDDEQTSLISETPETTKVVDQPEKGDQPDNRKPYSKPELRRLGKLSEISKKGLLVGQETLNILLRS
jgi:hypothetical protein